MKISAIVALTAIVAYYLSSTVGPNFLPTLGQLTATIHIIIGVVIFWLHGRRYITPIGVFALMSAVFLGVPYFYRQPEYESDLRLDCQTAAIALFCLSTALIVAIRIAPSRYCAEVYQRISSIWKRNKVVGIRYVFLHWILIIYGLWGMRSEGLFTTTGYASFFVGLFIGFYLVGAFAVGGNRFSAIAVLGGCLIAFWIFIDSRFTGFGRIRVASVGIGAATVASIAMRQYLVKGLSLAAVPFFLIWGGVQRSTNVTYSMRVLVDAEGLGSFLAPFYTLANIFDHFRQLVERGIADYQWGRTYLYMFSFWIPRSLWPGKPDGLGRMYVGWFRPELLETGHSMAGSYIGEGFVNFGIAGIGFAVLFAGFLVGILTRYGLQLAEKERTFRNNVLFRVVFVIIVCSSIPNYVWADTNTLIHRGVTQIAWLACVFGLGWLLGPKKRQVRG